MVFVGGLLAILGWLILAGLLLLAVFAGFLLLLATWWPILIKSKETEQRLAEALKEIEELQQRCRWLDQEVTTLRQQREGNPRIIRSWEDGS
jgi:hypothetical protein